MTIKNIFILLVNVFSFISVSAQETVVYETKNYKIGFGTSSDCANNQYMDFCINGPLLHKDGLPVGGYVDNGNKIQNWVEPTGGNFAIGNGVFGLGVDGKMHMFFYADLNKLPKMKWAIQNGPILVENGVNVRGTSQSEYKRSGIGYKTDGTICAIISQKPITFREFAQLFVDAGCINAMYLDGGPYVGYSDNQTYNTGMVDGAIKLQFYNN